MREENKDMFMVTFKLETDKKILKDKSKKSIEKYG